MRPHSPAVHLVHVALVGVVVAAVGCGSPTSPTPFQAPAPPGAPLTEGGLRIDRAVVVELQASGPTGWHYAPQVRVTEFSAGGPEDILIITGVDISAPDRVLWSCSTNQSLAFGQTLELFPEDSGEYPVTLGRYDRRLSTDWVFVVRFLDSLGRPRSITVSAPSTPGAILGPASGGPRGPGWSCRSQG
jgi:hypothetical protein